MPLVEARTDAPATPMETLKEGEEVVLPISLGRTRQAMNKAKRNSIMVHMSKLHQAKVNIMVQLLYHC